MRRNLLACLAAGLVLGGGGAAQAHHSTGATYDVNDTIQLKGTIVEFLFRNPHSFLQIEVRDESGQSQRWSLEWRDAGSLRRQGVDRSVLKVGDEVIVKAHPSRTKGARRAALESLRRTSDGFGWGDLPGEADQ